MKNLPKKPLQRDSNNFYSNLITGSIKYYFKQLIELEALEQRSQREKNNAKTIQTYFYVLAIIPIILTVIGWFLAHHKVI